MELLKIHMLNVGHGDSIIVEIPASPKSKERMYGLIDSNLSGNNPWPKALRWFKTNNIKNIEFICLTHPHNDHYSGMEKIFDEHLKNNIVIKEFWDCGCNPSVVLLQPVKEERKRLYNIYSKINQICNIEKNNKTRNNSFYWGARQNISAHFRKYANLKIYILYPDGDTINNYESQAFEFLYNKEKYSLSPINPNKLSVVLLLVWGDVGIIFGGDLDKDGWTKIIERLEIVINNGNLPKKIKFFKVSHHGSFESQYPKLYRDFAVKDKSYAFISGGVFEDLPSNRTLKLLKEYGIEIYCTNPSHDCSMQHVSEPKEVFLDLRIEEGFNQISEPYLMRYPKGYGDCTALIESKESSNIRVETETNLQSCLYRNGKLCVE